MDTDGTLDECVVRHAVYEAAEIAAERFPDLKINVIEFKATEFGVERQGWSICPGGMAAYLSVKMSGTGAVMRWWYDIERQLEMRKYFGPDEDEDLVHLEVATTLEAKLFE